MHPNIKQVVLLWWVLVGLLQPVVASADQTAPSDLLGKWFDYVWFIKPEAPGLILESDGSGSMAGNPIRWSYDDSSRLLTIKGSGDEACWYYLPKEKALFFKYSEEEQARIKRGDVVPQAPAFIREDSPIRKWIEPEANKALVPTVMSVTPAADAPVAPATTAAHL